MHLEHSYLFLKVGGNKYSERFPTFGSKEQMWASWQGFVPIGGPEF